MGVFITISKLLKQMCVLYIELFIEIGKMIKENTRKIIKCVFIGIGVFALCVALATAVFYSMGAYNKYIFTKENWNTYTSDRINMIKSLEFQYDFAGMNQAQVIDILGKPSYSTLRQNCEYIDLNKIDYDFVIQYELNKGSRSIMDMIDKNYVIAFKEDKVVYAQVLIADQIGFDK